MIILAFPRLPLHPVLQSQAPHSHTLPSAPQTVNPPSAQVNYSPDLGTMLRFYPRFVDHVFGQLFDAGAVATHPPPNGFSTLCTHLSATRAVSTVQQEIATLILPPSQLGKTSVLDCCAGCRRPRTQRTTTCRNARTLVVTRGPWPASPLRWAVCSLFTLFLRRIAKQ